MQDIVLLGSTGSIGTQTLDIVAAHPDRFRVVGLACRSNTQLMQKQIEQFRPDYVVVSDPKARLAVPKGVEVLDGEDALMRLAAVKQCRVVNALVGMDGLLPTLAAIRAGNTVALANKETLVAGGDLVMREARAHGVDILPVDSEHSAIWQCLHFGREQTFDRILLTASGGALRDMSYEQLQQATAAQALRHPNWSMGTKVTIDSATMMNKGLEIIEAMHLFGCDSSRIQVVIHPQSIVHSMIRYADGAVIAQMGVPDMRLPIQLALCYPDRSQHTTEHLSFDNLHLDFYPPDLERFPCLRIAMQCAATRKDAPAVMNAANEALVPFFVQGCIKFYDIPYYIERALDSLCGVSNIASEQDLVDLHRRTISYINQSVRDRT